MGIQNSEIWLFGDVSKIVNLKFKILANNIILLWAGILNVKFRIVFWKFFFGDWKILKNESNFMKKNTFRYYLSGPSIPILHSAKTFSWGHRKLTSIGLRDRAKCSCITQWGQKKFEVSFELFFILEFLTLFLEFI